MGCFAGLTFCLCCSMPTMRAQHNAGVNSDTVHEPSSLEDEALQRTKQHFLTTAREKHWTGQNLLPIAANGVVFYSTTLTVE